MNTGYQPRVSSSTPQISINGVGYATLHDARNAAVSGETIIVQAGDYAIDGTLAKDGVNWYFNLGAIVTNAGTEGFGIFDNTFGEGDAMSYLVSGYGRFIATLAGVVKVGSAGGEVTLEALSLEGLQDGADLIAQGDSGQASTLTVRANNIEAVGTAIHWNCGKMYITADRIAGGYSVLWPDCGNAALGDMYVDAKIIERVDSPSGGDGVFYCTSNDPASVIWVRATEIRAVAGLFSESDKVLTSQSGYGKIYIECEKIWGWAAIAKTCKLYIRAQKWQKTSDNFFLSQIDDGACEAHVTVDIYEDNGFAGGFMAFDTNGPAYVVISGGVYKSTSATAGGLQCQIAKVRVKGLSIDTSSSNATSPIINSGGVLILENCTIVAEASKPSILADNGPADTRVYGSYANTAVSADVNQVVGPLIVDAQIL